VEIFSTSTSQSPTLWNNLIKLQS